MPWYAVNTKPKNEDFAAQQLEHRGLEVFLPKIPIRRRRGARKITLLEPLFPGYLFVQFTPVAALIQQVNRTPGVRRLLCAGAFPVPVSDMVIAVIRQRTGPRGRRAPKPAREFPVGSRVAVRHGPLAGLIGIIERPVSGCGRVQVLLELLQRPLRVQVDAIDLDRLDRAGN